MSIEGRVEEEEAVEEDKEEEEEDDGDEQSECRRNWAGTDETLAAEMAVSLEGSTSERERNLAVVHRLL